MRPETLEAVRAHAATCFPGGSCGVIIGRRARDLYWPCRNLAAGTPHFHIHPEDYAAAEDAGDVLMIVHSHPNIAPIPSQADLVMCEETGLPWAILAWPTGALHEFAPNGYKAPLLRRVFTHGVLDCYTLIQDYYAAELKIDLPDFERPDNWWHTGLNLYVDNFAKAGFRTVDDLRTHDVPLMMLGKTTKPNHGGVYLGGDVLLHHPMNRLSGRETYAGYWQKITTHLLRHEALL